MKKPSENPTIIEEDEKKLTKESYLKAIHCQVSTEKTDDLALLIDAYKKAFSTPGKMDNLIYKTGYQDPQEENNQVTLHFRDTEAAFDFFTEQAALNRAFIVVDKDNNILAYSSGDGNLLTASGEPCKGYTDFSAKDKKPLDEAFKAEFNNRLGSKSAEAISGLAS